jgi:hypothetical protein
MSSRRALLALLSWLRVSPITPPVITATEASSEPESTSDEPTGGESSGLFACDSPPCKLVLVSQSLDDRVDVFDVTGTPRAFAAASASTSSPTPPASRSAATFSTSPTN